MLVLRGRLENQSHPELLRERGVMFGSSTVLGAFMGERSLRVLELFQAQPGMWKEEQKPP